MFTQIRLSIILSFSFWACLSLASASEVTFDQVQVQVNQQSFALEYAKTFEQRAQGLMFRKEMCANCGMLFKFEQTRRAGMWMKNTFIPLDVAFIRADGTITDIKAMQPHDMKTVSSSEPVQYAWEMNLAWFKQNNIKVGDTVTLLESN